MWLPNKIVKKHILPGKQRCVFLCYLLNSCTNAIIKANVIIVSNIRDTNSNLIICNKIVVSIIHTTSNHIGNGNHILLILTFLTIIFNFTYKVKSFYLFFKYHKNMLLLNQLHELIMLLDILYMLPRLHYNFL